MSSPQKLTGRVRSIDIEAVRTSLRELRYQFSLPRRGTVRFGSPDRQEFANNQATLIAAVETHRETVLAALELTVELAQMTPESLCDEVALKAALWDVIEAGYAYYGRPGHDGQHIREAAVAVLEQMQRTAERESKRTIGRAKTSY